MFKCLFDRLNNIIMKSLSTHYDGEPDIIIQHINMKIIFCEEHLQFVVIFNVIHILYDLCITTTNYINVSYLYNILRIM